MKFYNFLVSENLNSVFLYLLIQFATIDFNGVLDYAIKAIIGSAVWFSFRLLGDYFSRKLKQRQNNTSNKKQP